MKYYEKTSSSSNILEYLVAKFYSDIRKRDTKNNDKATKTIALTMAAILPIL